jgi:hypothetical protein
MANQDSFEDFRTLHQSILAEIVEKGVSKDGTIPGMVLYRQNESLYDQLPPLDKTRAQLDLYSALEERGLSPVGVSIKSKYKTPLALAQTADYVLAVIERSAYLTRQEKGM